MGGRCEKSNNVRNDSVSRRISDSDSPSLANKEVFTHSHGKSALRDVIWSLCQGTPVPLFINRYETLVVVHLSLLQTIERSGFSANAPDDGSRDS